MTETLCTTEFDFSLPRGFIDQAGNIHQQGRMRLSTARDELMLQKDRRVKVEASYGTLIMLSQVIIQLGSLSWVEPKQLERLFTQDLAYLKEFYNRVNQQGHALVPTQCPQCAAAFETELVLSGEW